jgi:hypothetical protein
LDNVAPAVNPAAKLIGSIGMRLLPRAGARLIGHAASRIAVDRARDLGELHPAFAKVTMHLMVVLATDYSATEQEGSLPAAPPPLHA